MSLNKFYNANTEKDQCQTINSLNEQLSKHDLNDSNPFLSGDMNVIFDIHLDALGGNPSLKTKSLPPLINLIDNLDMCDIFRVRFPNKKRFTFRQKSSKKQLIHRRLDYVFVPNTFQEYVTNVDILPSFQSDHSPVMVSFEFSKNHNRGRGMWKFNNSLLHDDGFCDGIKDTIVLTLNDNSDSNPHLKWEILKYELRKFSIKFSKNRSKLRNLQKNAHEKIVKDFETNPSPTCLQEQYDDSKSWLESWYDDLTKGAILRSKSEWYEKGEKSTKFFLNLEKKNSTKNTIRNVFIKNDDNTMSQSDDEVMILNHAKTFYETLFKRKSNCSFNECSVLLSEINTPTLSQKQKEQCDKMLAIEELSDSLDSMQSGKTPGNDGLTVEFYKTFWDHLKNTLYESALFSKTHGYLSISQRQAIIKLLEKKDKDKRFIENWRPISLLNVDTKIISKAFAIRLKYVLPDIISHDQTAYVKGRFIGESTRLISDILEISDDLNIGGYILTADIEKAFDSMDHQFLLAALHKFGFGTVFIDWIKTLLSKNESCVLNGGVTSTYFLLKRGARQGDPIAAYLFIIALEIFFILARSNNNIRKLNILENEFLLSAYADDTTFFVQDIASIRLILDIFTIYSTYSGFKLNLTKCELCGIGSLKGVPTALCGVKNVNLTSNTIRILGVHYSYDPVLTNDKNFISALKKIIDVLKVWKMRNLSLIGKITIFKTLAISKIIYISYMSCVPDEILYQLKNIHKDFIWGGKKAKIKHSTLIADYSQGGLRDIDIDTKIKALQLAWIKRLFDNNYHPWKILPKCLLSKTFPHGISIFFPNMEFKENGNFKKLPKFHQNLLHFWSEFSPGEPITTSAILSECIWHNRRIKIGGEVITANFLKLNRPVFVADFFDDAGVLKTWTCFQNDITVNNSLFFKWRQIIAAFPKEWTNYLTKNGGLKLLCEFRPHLISHAKLYTLEKLTSKELYKIVIQLKVEAPSSQKKILSLIGIEDLPWKKIYNLVFTTTIDSYSRIFQYKSLNSILFLNNILFKFGFSDSPFCSYCHLHKETIKHLFFNCDITKSMWVLIQTFFKDKIIIPDLDLQSAVLGFLDTDNRDNLLINNILLTFKMTLYKCRDGGNITFSKFFNNLKSRETIEKSIAHENGKLGFHHRKWKFFIDLIHGI